MDNNTEIKNSLNSLKDIVHEEIKTLNRKVKSLEDKNEYLKKEFLYWKDRCLNNSICFSLVTIFIHVMGVTFLILRCF